MRYVYGQAMPGQWTCGCVYARPDDHRSSLWFAEICTQASKARPLDLRRAEAIHALTPAQRLTLRAPDDPRVQGSSRTAAVQDALPASSVPAGTPGMNAVAEGYSPKIEKALHG